MTDKEWHAQNPIQLLEKWLLEAKNTPAVREPTAMAIATSSGKTGISNRIVLLKSFSPAGLSFFTNYESEKGKDLSDNIQTAALFYWDPLAKQVRITGPVEKTSRKESETYWASRARDSQLSQYISKQSQPVASREVLEKAVQQADQTFKDQPVPCPPHWGGYLLKPERFEFWESRPGRLHDRFLFTKGLQDWTCQRLYP